MTVEAADELDQKQRDLEKDRELEGRTKDYVLKIMAELIFYFVSRPISPPTR